MMAVWKGIRPAGRGLIGVPMCFTYPVGDLTGLLPDCPDRLGEQADTLFDV